MAAAAAGALHVAHQPAVLDWQQKRVWVHPRMTLLVTRVAAATAARGCVFECHLRTGSLAGMWDHRVMGKALVPGVAFMEMAARCLALLADGSAGAGSQALALAPALAGLTIPSPCILPDPSNAGSSSVLRCLVTAAAAGGQRVEVSSGAAAMKRVHLTAGVTACSLEAPTGGTSRAMAPLLATRAAAVLGAAVFAAIVAAAVPPAAAAATAEVCADSAATASSATASPGQLDAALQLSAVARAHLLPQLGEVLQVPAAADLYVSHTFSGHGGSLAATAAIRPGCSKDCMTADYSLATGAGTTISAIKGLQARAMGAAALAPAAAMSVAAAAAATAEPEVREHFSSAWGFPAAAWGHACYGQLHASL